MFIDEYIDVPGDKLPSWHDSQGRSHGKEISNLCSEVKLLPDLIFVQREISAVPEPLRKHGEDIKNEQEILLALSDIAISALAVESAVLRAEKIIHGLSPAKKDAISSVVQIIAFNGAERTGACIRKVANYIDNDGSYVSPCTELHRFACYGTPGLLKAKRVVADAAIEIEKYLF